MVKKDFNKEVELIEKTPNIKNKLQLFSIYEDLYIYLISTIGDINEDLANNYGNFLEKIFEIYIKYIKDLKKDISAKVIFESYLKEITKPDFLNIPPLKSIINFYQEELDAILIKSDFANIIEESDYDFAFKCQLLNIFKFYIQDMLEKITYLYGDSGEFLKKTIVEKITEYLPNILNQKDKLDLDIFAYALSILTRKIVIEIYHQDLFDFFNLQRGYSPDVKIAFDDIEKEIFISRFAYQIALYEDQEIVNDTESEYYHELASEYNIEPEEIFKKQISFKLKMQEFRLVK